MPDRRHGSCPYSRVREPKLPRDFFQVCASSLLNPFFELPTRVNSERSNSICRLLFQLFSDLLVLFGNLRSPFQVAAQTCIPVRHLAAEIPLPDLQLTDFLRDFLGVRQK